MKTTAQLFKALSEEIRLRIINLLSTGELCVCDLVAILDLPQSTVSRHLAYLRNCGLISDRRDGIWMYYRREAELSLLQQQFMNLLQLQLAQLQQGTEDLENLRRLRNDSTTCAVTE